MINKIKNNIPNFSKSEKKVCDLLIKNPELILTNTISSLSRLANTSTSAVLRFCKTLGYSGYKDFCADMIYHLKSTEQEDVRNPIQDITTSYTKALEQINALDSGLIEKLCKKIETADIVYCYGLYRSYLPAEKLQINLKERGVVSIASESPVAFSHNTNISSPDSLIILFSQSGEEHFFMPLVKLASENLTEVWLVPTTPTSFMEDYVSHTITLPAAFPNENIILDNIPVMMVFAELLSYQVNNPHK